MNIEVFLIILSFIAFAVLLVIFLVVKCVRKASRKSGIEEDPSSEDENAYNTTVYAQISASEDSNDECEEDEDIWND